MPELDGKATAKDLTTPFDAHDQALRNAPEYEHQEFPKAVAHVDGNGNPVTLEEITARPETHFEPVVEEE